MITEYKLEDAGREMPLPGMESGMDSSFVSFNVVEIGRASCRERV